MEYGTQPGRYHDPCRCCWRFHDRRGQLVATIPDEAFARARFSPREVVMAGS